MTGRGTLTMMGKLINKMDLITRVHKMDLITRVRLITNISPEQGTD